MNRLINNRKGMTLVELLAVIGLITISIAVLLPNLSTEMRYRSVAGAAHKAQEIATIIDYGRSIGMVGPFTGSLGEFIAGPANNVDAAMPGLRTTFELLGRAANELFQVEVGQYGVRVSFALIGVEYAEFRFPGTHTEIAVDEEAGATTVTWSTGPAALTSLNAAYGTHQLINDD